jgi:hypothetical protein
MDQEDSEDKIISENDERDWMTAKKFWKPGRVGLPQPPSVASYCPAALQKAPFKP